MMNEITYTKRGDYFYPDLAIPEQSNYQIRKYGLLRLEFLKKHRRGTYTTLLTKFRLNEHLHNIDEEAHEQVRKLTQDFARTRGISEELKSSDQLRWVAEMNNAKAAAEEIILHELIYV